MPYFYELKNLFILFVREREIERNMFHLLVESQIPTTVRLEQAKARTSSGSSMWVTGKVLRSSSVIYPDENYQEAGSEVVEVGLEPMHSDLI